MNDPTPTEAREVLFAYGAEGGQQPGSFAEALITAMMRADAFNLAKLRSAFPGYVTAVGWMTHFHDGADRLRQVAQEGAR